MIWQGRWSVWASQALQGNGSPKRLAFASKHTKVRPRKDKRGVYLISDALPFRRLWYCEPDDAVEYAKFFSRSHDAIIRVYDGAGTPTLIPLLKGGTL
jgi:hypothetical protein